MTSFWDFDVWGMLNLIAALLIGLLIANAMKRKIKIFRVSMIPTSVLGGLILLLVSLAYGAISGTPLFDTEFFSTKGNTGTGMLEIITYHALALGFIAQTFRESPKKFSKKRSAEIFDSGVTTVATYLLQGVLGLGITILVSLVVTDFFPASGLLLPFGYGQGTGQALNYGSIYETDWGFVSGKGFGLSIAALGFISASIGGVIHLNIMKKKGFKFPDAADQITNPEEIESKREIPMNGLIDKLTVQVALILIAYLIAYLMMFGLGSLLGGMKSVIYGFNFLMGVIAATIMKFVMRLLKKAKISRQYTNNFLLTHISNLCFDIMIVAGIAAIRLEAIKMYWWILIVLGVVGMISTYMYNKFIARKLFPEYSEQQFLAMYGMLTGTASTGVMLLREVDPKYETDASDNLVYQTLPAIVFGFPLMLLATLAPKEPVLTLIILAGFFVVMNIILFRRSIFKKKKK